MTYFHFLLCLFPLLGLMACTNNTAGDSQGTTTVEAEVATEKVLTIELFCQEDEPNADIPTYSVFAVAGEQKIEVAKVNSCTTIEKAQFENYHIPAEATKAVGGWFAGAGDYLYVLTEKGVSTVYQGDMGEMRLTNNFAYVPVAILQNGQLSTVADGKPSVISQCMGLYALGGHDNSWLMLVDRTDGKWQVKYKQIEGMLPPEEELPVYLDEFNLENVQDFEFNPEDLTFNSSLGKGQFLINDEGVFVTLVEVASHVDNQLRMSRLFF